MTTQGLRDFSREPTSVGDPAAGKYFLWYALVFLAAWNAVLRPSPSIPVTPYYLLMPLVGLVIAMRVHRARKWGVWFAAFASYGLVVGTSFGVPFTMQAAQLLKYAQLLTFFLILTCLYHTAPTSPARIHRLVIGLTVLVFVIAVVQTLTGLEFPTVVNEESALWLNTYFYTPNDLALFLSGVFCLVLCGNAAFWKKCLFFLAFVALNLRNDAKAAILASLVMIGMYALVLFCRRLRLKPIFGLFILVALIILAIVKADDANIQFGNSDFNFAQLIVDPVERIANLDPYNLGGSIFDRTDALIYSIEALKSMSWLGLGPAGSVYNLSLPNYELLTASSLHNAIAEVFVEFGPASLFLFYLVLRPFKRALLNRRPTAQQMCLMCFVVASPLLSVTQSSGYISNYAFWISAFLIWYPAAVRQPANQPVSSLNRPVATLSERTLSLSP